MRKKNVVLVCCAIALVVSATAGAAWAYFSFATVQTPQIPRDCRIFLEWSGPARNNKKERIEITDAHDRELLLRLFGKPREAMFDTPICPFGYFKISFAAARGVIDFYPAMDGCPLVRYGTRKKIFEILVEEKSELRELASRHGFPMPR